jgi:4'-phosphopantetheinyl transferase
VGIDVERRLPIDLREFRRVFTDREYDFLSGTPELTTCFYRLWTRKEAIMKADGRGISLDPAGIDVLTVPRMIGGIRYTLRELKVGPLHAGHLASAGPAGIESQWYRVADLLTQSY